MSGMPALDGRPARIVQALVSVAALTAAVFWRLKAQSTSDVEREHLTHAAVVNMSINEEDWSQLDAQSFISRAEDPPTWRLRFFWHVVIACPDCTAHAVADEHNPLEVGRIIHEESGWARSRRDARARAGAVIAYSESGQYA